MAGISTIFPFHSKYTNPLGPKGNSDLLSFISYTISFNATRLQMKLTVIKNLNLEALLTSLFATYNSAPLPHFCEYASYS